eukprot:3909586-Rhodomonas_salina.3
MCIRDSPTNQKKNSPPQHLCFKEISAAHSALYTQSTGYTTLLTPRHNRLLPLSAPPKSPPKPIVRPLQKIMGTETIMIAAAKGLARQPAGAERAGKAGGGALPEPTVSAFAGCGRK